MSSHDELDADRQRSDNGSHGNPASPRNRPPATVDLGGAKGRLGDRPPIAQHHGACWISDIQSAVLGHSRRNRCRNNRLGPWFPEIETPMIVPRYHLDSNILLRFLTGEPPDMFAAASALIRSAEKGEALLELSPLVLAETAFTLESYYRVPRKDVAKALAECVNRLGFRLADRERLLDALNRVQTSGVHLVDGYLAAASAETKMPVASFDRDFDKFRDVTRFEPKA